jgi:hypothetical protein
MTITSFASALAVRLRLHPFLDATLAARKRPSPFIYDATAST